MTLKGSILRKVMKHMNWDKEKAVLWYKTKNPLFGGISPQEMVVIGRGAKVLKMVNSIIEESI